MSIYLEWWKQHELQFPHLAKLARKHLAIPSMPMPYARLGAVTRYDRHFPALSDEISGQGLPQKSGPAGDNNLFVFYFCHYRNI